MAYSESLADPQRQTSIERGGLGQSGYTAGRHEGDTALERAVDTRRIPRPGSEPDGLGTDDRFTGRGGPVAGDVERDSPSEIVAPPYPQANGSPDPDEAG
jgi:hypothetical protein